MKYDFVDDFNELEIRKCKRSCSCKVCDKEVIDKDNIYKEIARNGQVFLLYNKVRNIEQQVEKISNLVPEANITYVHGQMSKTRIEKTMEDFVSMKYNVLICTTITIIRDIGNGTKIIPKIIANELCLKTILACRISILAERDS